MSWIANYTRVAQGVTTFGHELKINPLATVAAGEGFPVAILDQNEPAFYCIPAKAYEILLDRLEDAELAAIVESRKHQAEIEVAWDEL